MMREAMTYAFGVFIGVLLGADTPRMSDNLWKAAMWAALAFCVRFTVDAVVAYVS